MSFIADFSQAFFFFQRQQGWRAALGMAGQFLREPFYEVHNGYIMRKSLQDPINIPQADIEMEVQQIRVENMTVMSSIMPDMRVKRLMKKLQAGELCFAGLRDGKVIGYVLAGFAGTPSTEQVRVNVSPQEAYVWAGYALPEYRRQGVVRVINLTLLCYAREKGFLNAVLLVEKDNKPSLGHCHKMGYRITDHIIYRRILKWTTVKVAPMEDPELPPQPVM